jgi:CoA:oxalate CoA-transferase
MPMQSGDKSKNGPLHGINVLDMGTAGVGPFAATLLGYLGANVVRVEPPFVDMLYHQQPTQNGVSPAYFYSNLNKRNIILDLKEPSNWSDFERLIREADVVMENQRPGRLASLGASYEAMKAINPRIVYVQSPGWGPDGPMRDWFCAAGQADAFSGFGSMNGPEGGRPEMMRYPIMDPNASIYITSSVLLGLYARERTGESQLVALSQIAAGMAITINKAGEFFVTGKAPIPLGNASSSTAPHQAFLCQDQKYLAVGVESQDHWIGFCSAIERKDLTTDPRFSTNVLRVENRQALTAILEKVFITKVTRWWEIRLTQNRVPVGQFVDHLLVPEHIQSVENEFFVEMDMPQIGRVLFGGLPWRLSETPAYMEPPPMRGGHTEEVISDGFGEPSRASSMNGGSDLKAGELPLKGIKVVDLTQGLCGPYVSLLLADVGADVTKVEPLKGDYSREFYPQHRSGISAAFLSLNRNKKLISLDLASEKAKMVVKDLLRNADVLLLDWSPIVEQELGVDEQSLKELNPGLVSCSISAFGEKGPLSHRSGSELVIQAITGTTNFTGRIGEPPVRLGADVASMQTAVVSFQAVLAALYYKHHNGIGQRITTNMAATMNMMLSYSHTNLFAPDDWVGGYCDATISSPNNGYQAKDGSILIMMRDTTPEQFYEFCRGMGMQDVLDTDERFQNLPAEGAIRRPMRFDTREVWEKYTQRWTMQEIVDLAVANGMTAPAYHSQAHFFNHVQGKLQNMVKTGDTPWGKLDFLYPPWHGTWNEPEPDVYALKGSL